MGDNHHLYRHIRKSLMQIYPKQLTGRQAQQMNTLSGMISGIVRSGKSQMRAMAKSAPDRSKVESRIKRFTRFTQNEGVDTTTYFMPFLTPLLIGLARSGPLVLAIDGSEVGRNCLALVISVIYKKRALPLVWVVVQGSKGHFPEETHVQLVQAVKPCIPDGADVIFLGDGEFDGIGLQAEIAQNDWQYVFRKCHCQTREMGGNYPSPRRCDLSLFQLGLDLLEHFLNESLPIPVSFQMPIESN
jgi:hypothetical protein